MEKSYVPFNQSANCANSACSSIIGTNPNSDFGVRVTCCKEAPWSSAGIRVAGRRELRELLSPWPAEPGPDWSRRVDEPQTEAEVDALREAVRRSRPYGASPWTLKVAGKLHLGWTLYPRVRPEKPKAVGQNHGKELRPL